MTLTTVIITAAWVLYGVTCALQTAKKDEDSGDLIGFIVLFIVIAPFVAFIRIIIGLISPDSIRWGNKEEYKKL